MTKTIAAPAAYEAAFEAERVRAYPVVDRFESDLGYWLDPDRMLDAAKVLACPVKENPPNWQHGRVLYTWTREYLGIRSEAVTLLDIGTAKGYSALCLQWALQDSPCLGAVVSVDVLDPKGTETRNSVLECDGPKTLEQFLAPWPEAQQITFWKSTGIEWLKRHPSRVHLAFIDGKHKESEVGLEISLLARHQNSGDRVMFDDVQMPGVALAVKAVSDRYDIQYLTLSPGRVYALGVRK